MPPFAIAPCTIDDSSAVAKVHISAFWTDPTWVAIWPGKTLEYVTTQYAARLPHTFLTDRTHRRYEKVVRAQTGGVVGYARWTLPQLEAVDVSELWPSGRVPGVSDECAREAERRYEVADYAYDRALDVLDGPLEVLMDELTREKNYVVLDILAVHPEYWRQGIATKLVRSGILQIEKMGLGLDIFVRAKKAGLGLYRREGFELVDQLIQDASKYGIKEEYGAYFLVRKTNKESIPSRP